MKDNAKTVAGIVAVALLIAGVIFGGWEAGWWFTTQNANRDSHVRRTTYGYQQTLRDQITKGISDVLDVDRQLTQATGDNATALTAQRRAMANQVCTEATQVTGDPLNADQASWISQNCIMGSAK